MILFYETALFLNNSCVNNPNPDIIKNIPIIKESIGINDNKYKIMFIPNKIAIEIQIEVFFNAF